MSLLCPCLESCSLCVYPGSFLLPQPHHHSTPSCSDFLLFNPPSSYPPASHSHPRHPPFGPPASYGHPPGPLPRPPLAPPPCPSSTTRIFHVALESLSVRVQQQRGRSMPGPGGEHRDSVYVWVRTEVLSRPDYVALCSVCTTSFFFCCCPTFFPCAGLCQ